MVESRTAAMRDYELQRRKALEQIPLNLLHKGGRIRIDVRAGGIEIIVLRGRDVHHRGHFKLRHRLITGDKGLAPRDLKIQWPPDVEELRLCRRSRASHRYDPVLQCIPAALVRETAAATRQVRSSAEEARRRGKQGRREPLSIQRKSRRNGRDGRCPRRAARRS